MTTAAVGRIARHKRATRQPPTAAAHPRLARNNVQVQPRQEPRHKLHGLALRPNNEAPLARRGDLLKQLMRADLKTGARRCHRSSSSSRARAREARKEKRPQLVCVRAFVFVFVCVCVAVCVRV